MKALCNATIGVVVLCALTFSPAAQAISPHTTHAGQHTLASPLSTRAGLPARGHRAASSAAASPFAPPRAHRAAAHPASRR